MYFMWVPFGGAITPPTVGDGPVVLHVSGCAATLRESVRDLPLTALASAWVITDRELTRRPDYERLMGLVRLRELILDEVEARFPRRLRAWLRWGGPHRIHANGELVTLV